MHSVTNTCSNTHSRRIYADAECKRELVRSYIKKQATVQYKTPCIVHTSEYTNVQKLFTTNIQENYSHILAVFILQSEICVTLLHSLVQFVCNYITYC